MTKELEYNLLTGSCLHRQREWIHIQNINSDISLATAIKMCANEISFVGNILQSFQFEPVFTVAEIHAKNNIAVV